MMFFSALVDCAWDIFIEDTSKNSAKTPDVFYVKNGNGVFIPDEEAIVKVYFKPNKNVIIIFIQHKLELYLI